MVSQHDGSIRGSAVAVVTADEGIQKALENTLVGRALKRLEGPVTKLIHDAIEAARAETLPESDSTDKAAVIARPAAGGRCAKIWDALDRMSADSGSVPSLQQIRKVARQKRWNKSTATIQYYRWRNAHGITRASARATAANAESVAAQ